MRVSQNQHRTLSVDVHSLHGFILEMAVDVPMSCTKDLVDWEANFLKIVGKQRSQARRWNASGESAGLW